jgi:hypothetical protein
MDKHDLEGINNKTRIIIIIKTNYSMMFKIRVPHQWRHQYVWIALNEPMDSFECNDCSIYKYGKVREIHFSIIITCVFLNPIGRKREKKIKINSIPYISYRCWFEKNE